MGVATTFTMLPLVASTGPVLVRCWQRQPGTGLLLAHSGMLKKSWPYWSSGFISFLSVNAMNGCEPCRDADSNKNDA